MSNQIGKVLRMARISAGCSQADLAKSLGYKSPQYISNYERGTCLPSLKVIGQIIRKLEMTEIEQKSLIFAMMDNYRDRIEQAIGRTEARVRR